MLFSKTCILLSDLLRYQDSVQLRYGSAFLYMVWAVDKFRHATASSV